jgi:hypothetical protein
MHTTGMSFKAIGRQMGYQYTVVSRLVRKHTQTNNVKSTNSGRLMTLLDLSHADLRRFLTVLVDIRLLGSQCCLSTGLVVNGIRLIVFEIFMIEFRPFFDKFLKYRFL